MNNFFSKPAFHDKGLVSGFRDLPGHSSTFNNGCGNHLTSHASWLSKPQTHDASLETRIRLDGFNAMGSLERRTKFLDSYKP